MRPLTSTLSAVLICAAAACAPTSDGASGERLTDADVTAIRSLGQEFTRATVAHDYDRVVALHTDDVAWMAPGAPAALGPAALRQSLENGARALSFVITPAHTEGVGSLAYDRGGYTYTGVLGSDTVSAAGKYVQILRRQADGSWRIALAIWNDDAPPAPTPAVQPRRQ